MGAKNYDLRESFYNNNKGKTNKELKFLLSCIDRTLTETCRELVKSEPLDFFCFLIFVGF